MLENEVYIIGNSKEDNPERRDNKIIRWFMINEVSTSPFHPSYYLPEWQQNNGERDQNDAHDSLTKSDQTFLFDKKRSNIPTGKRK